MGRTIRQHYVPKSYLKRFSFDGKRLYAFIIRKDIPSTLDPNTIKEYKKELSISDVCLAKHFYTIDENNASNNLGMKSMALEKEFFQDYVEPKLSSVIKEFSDLAEKILENKISISSVKLSDRQLFDLALCTFVQYHRTPRIRKPFEDINNLMKYVIEENYKNKPDNYSNETKGLDLAFTHADKTFLNPYLWKLFFSKISSYCFLLRVSENGNFFTSDNPVVIHKENNKGGKDIFNVNFFNDNFMVFYPLTPNLMLEYYNPVSFPNAVSMHQTISLVDKAYENQVNKYQYINADNIIFSPKNDFSLFIRKHNE